MKIVSILVGLLILGFVALTGSPVKFFGLLAALGVWGAYWALTEPPGPSHAEPAVPGRGYGHPGAFMEGWRHTEEDLFSMAERSGHGVLTVESLLPTLSPDNARKLLELDACRPIDLARLTTLSVETAAVLGGHQGPLMLNGLVELSPECARHLAGIPAPLGLNGVRTLSVEAAAALGRHHGWLFLDGLKSLPPDVAGQLATHSHIMHLGECYNALSLNGVESLTAEAAAALACFLGNLRLNGLTSLVPEVARRLAKHRTDGVWSVAETYSLLLDGVTTLSDEAAMAIAEYRGGLSLDGLEALSPAALAALARHPGGALSLGRLRSMPDDVAVSFGERPKWLHMPSLRDVSPVALAALRRNPDVILPEDGGGSDGSADERRPG